MLINNPLFRKLRVQPGNRLCILNGPEWYLHEAQGLAGGVVVVRRLDGQFDAVHLFVRNVKDLNGNLPRTWEAVAPNGTLWVGFPKKTSGIQTDLSRDKGWDILGSLGLSGVSLVSISDEWSAFRLKAKHVDGGENLRRPPEKESKEFKECINPVTRTVKAPADLKRMLLVKAMARQRFESLAYTHKKEFVAWILTAKTAETRGRRIVQTVERLTTGLKNPSQKAR